jgi:hypothetical protein
MATGELRMACRTSSSNGLSDLRRHFPRRSGAGLRAQCRQGKWVAVGTRLAAAGDEPMAVLFIRNEPNRHRLFARPTAQYRGCARM